MYVCFTKQLLCLLSTFANIVANLSLFQIFLLGICYCHLVQLLLNGLLGTLYDLVIVVEAGILDRIVKVLRLIPRCCDRWHVSPIQAVLHSLAE